MATHLPLVIVAGAVQQLPAGDSVSGAAASGASSITNTPAGGIAATDVQAAINELDTEKQATLVSGTNIKTVNGTSLVGSGNVAIDTYVVATTPGTSAFEYVTGADITYSPAGSTSLVIANYGRITYTGAGDITGGGHPIGVNGQAVMNASGRTASLVIGTEGSLDNQNGTVTIGIGVVGTLIDNAASQTIAHFVSLKASVNANHGTVTNLIGVETGCPTNAGTITNYIGLNIVDMSGVTGINRKRAILNNNTDAPIVSRSAICDSSLSFAAPADASTVVIPRDTSTVILIPDAALAALTITWPTDREDGQTVVIFTTQAITSVSYTAGPTLYGAPNTLAAGSFFTMRFFSSIGGWIRIG